MSKKKNKININRKGDVMVVKVLDQTYRCYRDLIFFSTYLG